MKARVARYLHKPARILVLEQDEFIIFAAAVFFLLFALNVYAFVVMMALLIIYRKIKATQNRGFFDHIVFMVGLRKFSHFDHVFVKRFSE